MPSRTTVECAVRMIVVAISSVIDWSAFATICSVTGSAERGGVLMRAPSRSSTSVPVAGVAAHAPARRRRRRSCRTRRRAAGPARRLRADRGPRAHRHLGASAAEPHPAGRVPVGHERVGDVERRSRRPTRRAPRAARRAPAPASRAGRARRRAPRARPRSAPAARERGTVDRARAAARPRSPSSGRRSGGRPSAPTPAPRARRTPARSSPSISSSSAATTAGSTASTSRWQERTSWNSGRAKRSPTALKRPATGGHEDRASRRGRRRARPRAPGRSRRRR